MSAVRVAKSGGTMLYTGERARAVFRVLDALVSFVPELDREVLRVLVPGVRRLRSSYATDYSVVVDVADESGGLTSVKLVFDKESNALYAKTKLPVDKARRVIEELIKVFYNYLFVLNAYYGRASWVNEDRAQALRKILTWLHGVRGDVALALPDLAVLDEKVVKDLLHILPNLRVEVKLPPGAVDKSELWKHTFEPFLFLHFDKQRIGPYVVAVDYNPNAYSLSVQLMLFDEIRELLIPGATLRFEFFGDIVRFWVYLSDLPSIEDIRWIVENRCYMVMEATKLLEKAYGWNQKFLGNIGLFRRIAEEACRQLGQHRGDSR
ncbi:MAG: hypothetical protein QXU26_03325 [Thermofilaceae archaeon]